jgi:hypothetical protein
MKANSRAVIEEHCSASGHAPGQNCSDFQKLYPRLVN